MLSFKPTFSVSTFTFIKRLFNTPKKKKKNTKPRILRPGEDTSASLEKSEFCALTTSSHFPDSQIDYLHLMDKEIKSPGPHKSEGSEHLIYRPTLSLWVLVTPSRKLSCSHTRPSEGPGHTQPWYLLMSPGSLPSPSLDHPVPTKPAWLIGLLRSAAARGRALHTISSQWRRLVLGSVNSEPRQSAFPPPFTRLT